MRLATASRTCPACRDSMRVDGEFYRCPCGCRVHASYFDRVASEPLGPNPEPSPPPLPSERKEAAWMAHDIVMGATEFIERWKEAGLIEGNADQLRQRIAELANDVVFEAWK